MWCVMGHEFSNGNSRGEFRHLGHHSQSETQNRNSPKSGADAPRYLSPEREAEIRKNLGDLIESDLDYQVLWKLPNGERILV
jgi:hypothetical protein